MVGRSSRRMTGPPYVARVATQTNLPTRGTDTGNSLGNPKGSTLSDLGKEPVSGIEDENRQGKLQTIKLEGNY